MITEQDGKDFKNLIKASINRNQSANDNLPSNQKDLNFSMMEAYEIGFHLNFNPTLTTTFCKCITKHSHKCSNDLDKLT